MDDLGFNKIAGAVLAVVLGMLLLMKLPGILMNGQGEEIAYKVGPIDVPGGDEEEIELPFPQADWVAAMDAAKGARVFRKCQSCHNVEPGGANGTGPALYGVVMNGKGVHEGYSFSTALAIPGEIWTYESLDKFLEKPSAYAPGTKMNFVGLKKPEDRAAVIEYLRVADSAPSPRPEPALAEPVVETEMSVEEPATDPTE
jgi:cytochrome c